MKRRVKLKFRALITFSIMIVLIGYVSYSIIYYGISKNKYENEQKELQTQLYELKDKEGNLNDEIDKLKDEDYLARYAREEYLYSKDGEYIIKIEENNNTLKKVAVAPQKLTKYIVAFIVLVILTIIMMILKKKGFKRKLS